MEKGLREIKYIAQDGVGWTWTQVFHSLASLDRDPQQQVFIEASVVTLGDSEAFR